MTDAENLEQVKAMLPALLDQWTNGEVHGDRTVGLRVDMEHLLERAWEAGFHAGQVAYEETPAQHEE